MNTEQALSKTPRMLVGDLEADGLLDTASTVHCGVWKCIKTSQVWKFRPNEIQQMLEFIGKADYLIMHNGLAYDLPLLEKLYQWKYNGTVIDTMVMSKVMRINLAKPTGHGKVGPHSIEAYGIRYGRYKPEHEDWSRFTEAMLHRCTEDVHITHELYTDLMKNSYTPAWKQALSLSHKFFDLTSKMERYGWLFDTEKANRLIGILEYMIRRIDREVLPRLPLRLTRHYKTPVNKPFTMAGKPSAVVLDWLQRYGGSEVGGIHTVDTIGGPFSRFEFQEFNLGSDQQVKEFLLSDGWEPQEWNYKKDKFKRDILDENGDRIPTSPKLSQDDEFIGLRTDVGLKLAKRVQIQHRLSYLQGLLRTVREDQRIGCSVAGLAKTYRVRHRGIVNTPGAKAWLGSHVRSLFKCKPGFKLVSVDASNCQVRLEAARADDPVFTKMLLEGKKEDGTDNHSVVTKAVNRVLQRYNRPLINRDIGKNFNFAMKFGCGDGKLAKMAGMDTARGAEVRASIAAEFQAQDRLVKRLTNEWRKNAKVRKKGHRTEFYDGWVQGLDGRPVYIDSEHKVLVYMLQSDETIVMQVAMCYWYNMLSKLGLQHGVHYGFVAHYHDEMTIEIMDEYADKALRLGENSIVKAGEFFNLAVPQLGEGAIGLNWRDVH